VSEMVQQQYRLANSRRALAISHGVGTGRLVVLSRRVQETWIEVLSGIENEASGPITVLHRDDLQAPVPGSFARSHATQKPGPGFRNITNAGQFIAEPGGSDILHSITNERANLAPSLRPGGSALRPLS